MRCPYCTSSNSQVKDSRPVDEHAAIRRRRICDDCGGRFTTFERVQMKDLIVIKRSGRRQPFERDKLARSIDVALRKRAVTPERFERLVTGLVRQIESTSEGEVTTDAIGTLVMEALKGLDGVAFVRFASVYKDFKLAKDFHEVLNELAREEVGMPAPRERAADSDGHVVANGSTGREPPAAPGSRQELPTRDPAPNKDG